MLWLGKAVFIQSSSTWLALTRNCGYNKGVKANETERAAEFTDRKESSEMLREISVVSRFSEEPDWEFHFKKQMFKWVIIYGGAILAATALALTGLAWLCAR